ncbi:hypothetical protein KY285_011619 [Solanum tuberosum]|nr:hypothetical protein KY285_011619 [Solanum tuberosum]
MDDSTPSKRITRVGFTQDFGVNAGIEIQEKNDPIALPEVINNVKASDIKIVEGKSKRKAKDSDSEEVVSPSLDQDKYKEHQVFA